MSVIGAMLSVGLAMSALGLLMQPGTTAGRDAREPAAPVEQPRQAKPTGPPSPISVSGADSINVIQVVTTSRNLVHNVVIQEVANRDLGDVRAVIWPLSSPTASSFPIGVCGSPNGEYAKAPFGARELVKLCIDAELLSVGTYRATFNLSYRDPAGAIQRDSYVIAIERRIPPTTFGLGGLPVGPIETSFDLSSIFRWSSGSRASGPEADPVPPGAAGPQATAGPAATPRAGGTPDAGMGAGPVSAAPQDMASQAVAALQAAATLQPTMAPQGVILRQAAEALQATTTSPPSGLPETEVLPVTVAISEIAGQELVVLLPRLVQFSQHGENDTTVQSDPGKVRVRDSNGALLPEDARLTLKPKSTTSVDLLLPVRLGPGQYRARIEAATDDGAVAQTDIDIRVRHPWYWAFIMIVVGAIVSYLLRQWIATGRQRIMQARQIERSLDVLRSDQDDPLVDALRQRLESARDDFSIGNVDAGEVCRDTNELLILVRDLRGRIRAQALPRNLAHVVGHAELQARAALSTYSKEQAPQARNALGAVGSTLEIASEAKPLQLKIDYLRRQIGQADDPDPRAPVAVELRKAQDCVDEAVAAALAALATSTDESEKAIEDGLKAGKKRYAVAEKLYLDVCRDQVTNSLQAWQAIFPELKADPTYGVPPDQLVSARTVLDNAVARLAGLPIADNLAGSLNGYDAIIVDIQQIEKTLTSKFLLAVLMSPGRVPCQIVPRVRQASVRDRLDAAVRRPFAAGAALRDAAVRGPVQQFFTPATKVRTLDFLVTAVVSVFSALIGIQLLWIPNLTFGGLNDYITALVWGFGLHQLNEAARQGGPSSIRNALGSSSG